MAKKSHAPISTDFYEEAYAASSLELYCVLYRYDIRNSDSLKGTEKYQRFKARMQENYSLSNIRQFSDALTNLDDLISIHGVYDGRNRYDITRLEHCEKTRNKELHRQGLLTSQHNTLIPIIEDRSKLCNIDEATTFLHNHSAQLIGLTSKNTALVAGCIGLQSDNQRSPVGDDVLQAEANRIYNQLYQRVAEWKRTAVDDDNVHLVLVASQHNSAAVEMAQLMIVDIASKLNIKKILVEHSLEDYEVASKDCDKNIQTPVFLGTSSKAAWFMESNKQIYFAQFLYLAKQRGIEIIPADVSMEEKSHAKEVSRAAHLNPTDQLLQAKADELVVQARNQHMLSNIPQGESSILIVGAAHTPGIIDSIKKTEASSHKGLEEGAACVEMRSMRTVDVIDLTRLAPPAPITGSVSARYPIDAIPNRMVIGSGYNFNCFTPNEILNFASNAALSIQSEVHMSPHATVVQQSGLGNIIPTTVISRDGRIAETRFPS